MTSYGDVRVDLKVNGTTFTSEQQIKENFLRATGFKLSINDEVIEFYEGAIRRAPNDRKYYMTSAVSTGFDTRITIQKSFFNDGENTLKLEAPGYKPITITIPK